MTEMKFTADKPIMYFDNSMKTSIYLLAEWEVLAEAGETDELTKSTVPMYAEMALNDVLYEYSRTVPYSALAEKYDEISTVVSEKMTEKLRLPCTAKLISLKPDERSAKMMEQLALMEKMKDPAYAAEQMERAMQQARETAEKNGIDLSALQNMPMPDMPAVSETDDTLARAQAMAAHYEQLKKAAAAAPVYAAAAQQTAPRPVFCGSCGGKLPESGNFCPNCGAKI